jgi:hypothetical protein
VIFYKKEEGSSQTAASSWMDYFVKIILLTLT